MNGFKRINPTNVEAMQGTAAALAQMSVKEDELTATAQVISSFCSLKKTFINCKCLKTEGQLALNFHFSYSPPPQLLAIKARQTNNQ